MVDSGVKDLVQHYGLIAECIKTYHGWEDFKRILSARYNNYTMICIDNYTVLLFSDIGMAIDYGNNVLADLMDSVVIESAEFPVQMGDYIEYFWVDISDIVS